MAFSLVSFPGPRDPQWREYDKVVGRLLSLPKWAQRMAVALILDIPYSILLERPGCHRQATFMRPWTRNWSPASTEHKNKSCQQPHWVNVEEDILLVEPACESPASWCISCGRSYATVTQLHVPGWRKKCHCFELLDARAACLVAMDSQDKWQGNEANLQGLVPLSEGKSCHRAGVAEIGPNWRPDVLSLPSLSLLGWFPSQASRRGLWFFPRFHKDTRLFRRRWLSSLTPL